MKEKIAPLLGILILVTTISDTHATTDANSTAPKEQITAPYLLAGAPTFDMTLVKFREKFNHDNPTLPINEFHIMKAKHDSPPLTRAAVKINENLYLSTALEKATGKIKTLQITLLPINIDQEKIKGKKDNKSNEEKKTRLLAIDYMAALMRQFNPTFSVKQSIDATLKLLESSKESRFYTRSVDTIRYVIVDKGEKGLTFAVEPIKLALPTP